MPNKLCMIDLAIYENDTNVVVHTTFRNLQFYYAVRMYSYLILVVTFKFLSIGCQTVLFISFVSFKNRLQQILFIPFVGSFICWFHRSVFVQSIRNFDNPRYKKTWRTR